MKEFWVSVLLGLQTYLGGGQGGGSVGGSRWGAPAGWLASGSVRFPKDNFFWGNLVLEISRIRVLVTGVWVWAPNNYKRSVESDFKG